MKSLRAHVRTLWPGPGWVLPLVLAAWPFYCILRGELRWEILLLAVAVPALGYATAATKKLFVGLFPIGLVGVLYDSMRFFKNAGITPERVHICDLRAVELSLFGLTSGGVRMTVQDWFQLHPVRWLDFYCAIPYGTFIEASLVFAVFLYRVDFTALRRYTWTFLALNVAAFVTYHVYPAAPPWYFHAHGCVADLTAHANEGANLARVDVALGFQYFRGFYGRSNDVFGAVPSLHVAYPMLIVLEGWKHFGKALRGAAVLFFVSMCFAAVYLDHHWIIDVLIGILYCLIIHTAARAVFSRTTERHAATSDVALARG